MMHPVFVISFRNFLRQKRRNLLLGFAIAFGVMVLTVAAAFSKGITDNLLNRVIVYMSGHIRVGAVEHGRYTSPVFRDKEQIYQKVRNSVTGIDSIVEDVSAYCRAIGQGKSDYVFLVGLDLTPSFSGQFPLQSGRFESFKTESIQNPVLLSENKAKALNVKVGDSIRIRLSTINGEQQTGVLTVAAILKSQSTFMDFAVFVPLPKLKTLLGYTAHETGALKIILKTPQTAIAQANHLHENLEPVPAYLEVHINGQPAILTSFSNHASANVVKRALNWSDTEWHWANGDRDSGLIINQVAAKQLGVKVGDSVAVSMKGKFDRAITTMMIPVAAITKPAPQISPQIIWLPNDAFFSRFNYHYPEHERALSTLIQLPKKDVFWAQLPTEWELLDRTSTTKGFTKKMKDVMRSRRAQTLLDVSTMYETASQIVKMESVLTMLTLAVTGVLFFIILIGTLNSLQMSIRERTQEIGTMRAIGMNRGHIRWVFILEVFYLVIAGWLAGLLWSAITIKLLELITFSADNPLTMIMVDRHLYFLPTLWHLARNFLIVMIFALFAAYLPARRAAKLKPAEAFSHITN